MADFIYRATPWAITLVRHDWLLFVGAVAVLYAMVRLFNRPSRRAALFLYGWLIIVIAFEYVKHGVPELLKTTNYLFSSYANPSWRTFSRDLVLDVMPPALYVAGVVMVALSVAPVPGSRSLPNERSPRRY